MVALKEREIQYLIIQDCKILLIKFHICKNHSRTSHKMTRTRQRWTGKRGICRTQVLHFLSLGHSKPFTDFGGYEEISTLSYSSTTDSRTQQNAYPPVYTRHRLSSYPTVKYRSFAEATELRPQAPKRNKRKQPRNRRFLRSTFTSFLRAFVWQSLATMKDL